MFFSLKLCILQSGGNPALHTGVHMSNDLGSLAEPYSYRFPFVCVILCLSQPHWPHALCLESSGKVRAQIWASLSTKAARLHKLQKNCCSQTSPLVQEKCSWKILCLVIPLEKKNYIIWHLNCNKCKKVLWISYDWLVITFNLSIYWSQ